jgi:hypothetical protein
MKISFDEVLPPDVLLYAGTQNSSFCFDFGGALDQSVLFSPLTLKITVKVIYFQGQYIKSNMLKISSYHTLKLVILNINWKFENLTLKMKISFDDILPPDVLLYTGTQNSSFFYFWGVLDQMYFFHLWPWKWRSRSYIFKVKISKASSEWKTENLS